MSHTQTAHVLPHDTCKLLLNGKQCFACITINGDGGWMLAAYRQIHSWVQWSVATLLLFCVHQTNCVKTAAPWQQKKCSSCCHYYYYTRKLCYRKDDRAMRPMGALKIFGTPWLRPRHYSRHFHGLLFRSTLWLFLQILKSVALPVPEIIGGTQKIWAVTGYAHAPYSPKLLMGFYSDRPCKYTRQIWSP